MKITSITRSDVFGNHAGRWFMASVQMQPIYRMRDGYEKLGKNEEVFEQVRKRLRSNEGVLIFSEGNHGDEYYLRPLQKGSARMALESQEVMMEKDIYVVPVGLNYFHHQRPFHKLTAAFGDPIKVRDYFDLYREHPARGANKLRDDISQGMKTCLLLPEEGDDYLEKKEYINRRNEEVSFEELKKGIGEKKGLRKPGKPRAWLRQIAKGLGIFNFLPLLIIQIGLTRFRDIVFHCSIKWLAALFLFPVWWFVLFVVILIPFDWKWALLTVIGSVCLLFARQWLIRISNVPHHNED